ncbi:MAG: hypothetical protein FIA92_13035 [Chloroflexi bacterium]|nr:hypothetical protein [Chloroflexota bacterium]
MAESTTYRGEIRAPGAASAAASVSLEADGFRVMTAGGPAWGAAYRDVTTLVLDAGTILIELGTGTTAERWLLERFGPGLAAVARGLRDGRMRQWLGDGLVELDHDEPIELVEVTDGPLAGVAQLRYHRRGVALAPLDERRPRLRIRRADIGSVEADPVGGRLRVRGPAGPLAGDVETVELRGLGQSTTAHAAHWTDLRDAAAADQAASIASLIPDASFSARRQAEAVLREGIPADPGELGEAWPLLERAALAEPTFAASYRALLSRAGGAAAKRWFATAPEAPGAPDPARAWFLVGLPGNLLALELVSEGAHATYLFRVEPRASFDPEGARPEALRAAVRDVSEALIDARYLREPMALPAAQLAKPEHLRYRLALAALPSLAAARSRFVARITHRDETSWMSALDDLIGWHASARDEAAEWPGRGAQETAIDETT